MKKWMNHNLKHYGMLLPFFLLFGMFFLYPIAFGFKTSFENWDGIHQATFVGVKNYVSVFNSRDFAKSYINLLKYVSITVPIGITVALVLALIIDNIKGPASNFFRSAYFMPSMIPLFLAASIWRWLYAVDTGFLNTMLGWFGIASVRWLSDPNYMLISLIIVDVWVSSGFNMVILLAGLKNIPRDYYDAAKVDGANKLEEIRHITIPLMEPVLFFSITYGFISALQVFDAPWLLTTSTALNYGGRLKTLLFPVMDMMGRGFGGLKFGQAAASGFILTMLILFFTSIQFMFRKKN